MGYVQGRITFIYTYAYVYLVDRQRREGKEKRITSVARGIHVSCITSPNAPAEGKALKRGETPFTIFSFPFPSSSNNT